MRAAVCTLSVLLFGLRGLLTWAAFLSGTLGGCILGALSLVSLCTTVVAWISGEPDLTWRGLSVGLLHLAVLLLQPGASPPWLAVVFWGLVLVQCWAKWELGRRCTVTGPVWVNCIERGPYAIVRHPMTATEAAIAVAVYLSAPTTWNTWALLFVLVAKVLLTIAEERFLRAQPAYIVYTRRVRWRWVPHVW